MSSGLADSGSAQVGALLVATPLIDEPTFRRAVILMLEHSDEGSLGVVLNDGSQLRAAELLPEWGGVLDPLVAVGGPVQTDAGVAVARVAPSALRQPPPGLRLLEGRWGVLDLDGVPEQLGAVVETARLFLGYAGWAGGQLDEELRSGSWWVVPALPGDLSTPADTSREHLWRTVLLRQPSDLRFASTFPDKPELN